MNQKSTLNTVCRVLVNENEQYPTLFSLHYQSVHHYKPTSEQDGWRARHEPQLRQMYMYLRQDVYAYLSTMGAYVRYVYIRQMYVYLHQDLYAYLSITIGAYVRYVYIRQMYVYLHWDVYAYLSTIGAYVRCTCTYVRRTCTYVRIVYLSIIGTWVSANVLLSQELPGHYQ